MKTRWCFFVLLLATVWGCQGNPDHTSSIVSGRSSDAAVGDATGDSASVDDVTDVESDVDGDVATSDTSSDVRVETAQPNEDTASPTDGTTDSESLEDAETTDASDTSRPTGLYRAIVTQGNTYRKLSFQSNTQSLEKSNSLELDTSGEHFLARTSTRAYIVPKTARSVAVLDGQSDLSRIGTIRSTADRHNRTPAFAWLPSTNHTYMGNGAALGLIDIYEDLSISGQLNMDPLLTSNQTGAIADLHRDGEFVVGLMNRGESGQDQGVLFAVQTQDNELVDFNSNEDGVQGATFATDLGPVQQIDKLPSGNYAASGTGLGENADKMGGLVSIERATAGEYAVRGEQLISGQQLGGVITDFAMTGNEAGFASLRKPDASQQNPVVYFDASGSGDPTVTPIDEIDEQPLSHGMIELTADGKYVWIADSGANGGVTIFDPATRDVIAQTSFSSGGAPTDLVAIPSEPVRR